MVLPIDPENVVSLYKKHGFRALTASAYTAYRKSCALGVLAFDAAGREIESTTDAIHALGFPFADADEFILGFDGRDTLKEDSPNYDLGVEVREAVKSAGLFD